MTSSGDDMTVIDSSTIFIGTTDDEGWAKYGVSDTGSDSTKNVARKKEVKVEEKAEDSDKKDPEEQEKDKEEELVNRMTVMDLKPVVDSTSSKSLPVDPSLLRCLLVVLMLVTLRSLCLHVMVTRKSLCLPMFLQPLKSQLLWNLWSLTLVRNPRR